MAEQCFHLKDFVVGFCVRPEQLAIQQVDVLLHGLDLFDLVRDVATLLRDAVDVVQDLPRVQRPAMTSFQIKNTIGCEALKLSSKM